MISWWVTSLAFSTADNIREPHHVYKMTVKIKSTIPIGIRLDFEDVLRKKLSQNYCNRYS